MIDIHRTEHVDGISWFDAPKPHRLHRCRPQSTAYDILGLVIVERCACGAVRFDADTANRPWIERNSRRGEPT